MCDNQAEPVGLPEAIENLQLMPGPTTRRSFKLCSEDPDHNVMEPTSGWWDPLYQRFIAVEGARQHICNDCSSPIETEEMAIRNPVAITMLLEKIGEDQKLLARLLDDPREKPWKRHACRKCGSERVMSMFWCINDPVLLTGRLNGYFGGHDTSNAPCIDCDARDSRMLEMSNHESLELAVKMRGEITRLEAERAEIDSWLAAHGHVFGWAAPEPSSPELTHA